MFKQVGITPYNSGYKTTGNGGVFYGLDEIKQQHVMSNLAKTFFSTGVQDLNIGLSNPSQLFALGLQAPVSSKLLQVVIRSHTYLPFSFSEYYLMQVLPWLL